MEIMVICQSNYNQSKKYWPIHPILDRHEVPFEIETFINNNTHKSQHMEAKPGARQCLYIFTCYKKVKFASMDLPIRFAPIVDPKKT
jgi:hypothetical protein